MEVSTDQSNTSLQATYSQEQFSRLQILASVHDERSDSRFENTLQSLCFANDHIVG